VIHDSAGIYGLTGGEGSTMTNCTALNNTTAYPFSAARGSTLINCSASHNNCTMAIFADSGSSLFHCKAYDNLSTTSSGYGISTGSVCLITDCTSSFNRSTAFATPSSPGFVIGTGSTIQGCTSSNNNGDGIVLYGACLARENTCRQNIVGIQALNSTNRVEANMVVLNQKGIEAIPPNNVIVKNTATGNTINYAIGGGNVFGAIVDRTNPAAGSVSGNSAPSSMGTTDPWANITY
jgi:parallel beta-helix repeat protein